MVLSWAVAGSFGDALALMIQQVGDSIANRPSGVLDKTNRRRALIAPAPQGVFVNAQERGCLPCGQQHFQRAGVRALRFTHCVVLVGFDNHQRIVTTGPGAVVYGRE